MKEHYDLVISGMGPAGMACALTVAENMNKNILIISNRGDEFSRVQHIIFDMGFVYYLSKIIKKIPQDKLDGMPYLRKIKGNILRIGVALKDIERALHECIKFLPNIDIMYFSELSEINMENGVAEIADLKDEIKKTSVSFSHIIGADGVKHHAANIYNASCSLNEDKIHYEPSALSSALHPWHFFCCLTLSTKDGCPIRVPEKSFFVSVLEESSSTELQLLGMMFLYPSRKPAKSNQLKIKLSSDITEELYMRLKVDAGRDDAMRLVQNHVEDALKQSGFTESEISNIEIGNPGLSVKSGIKKTP
ncbi:hypothetical protein [Legionella sp. CNM-4043-24]|uniref:hypothetical protein n=1 Tax=Legionella sp. CNM-4043-24 TaxID=3421646 RepID=UPI00403AE5E4